MKSLIIIVHVIHEYILEVLFIKFESLMRMSIPVVDKRCDVDINRYN